jgi:hypothetical protein
MTIKVTIYLDMEKYNAKYGPGSDWAKEYTPMEHSPSDLEEIVEYALSEAFYDWDCNDWLHLDINS